LLQEKDLLSDRVKFKLYAAEYHLNLLKEIDVKYGNILKDRINAEIQIDDFSAQIIEQRMLCLFKLMRKKI
jgi:hypothetical protein